jgi:predicted acyltransferase
VNDPGSWDHIYSQLEHASWNGWTFTDTVFPFFVWISGVALTLSFARRVERGDNKRNLFLHVLRRAALIFAIGLFLNGFPFFPWDHIRYLGVLQRIAICYLICGGLFLVLRVRGLIVTTVALLTGYWLLVMLVPVPGCGAGHLGQDCNLEQYVDGLVLTGHMWSHTKIWDPEGLVSTIPAIATMLFGILTGYLLRGKQSLTRKTQLLLLQGICLIAAGQIMNLWLPINKSLWTSSYSVFMAGLASLEFAILYWIVDGRQWQRWATFFRIYGMNALAVFILTGMIGRLLEIITTHGEHLEAWIYRTTFEPLASPLNASLLYAIANVLFYFLLIWIMYRRKWFLRV